MAELEPRERRGLRLLGHPAHAALSAFPIALLSASFAVDGAALLTGDASWWRVSFWAVAAGLVAAVPTACAGLVDLAALAGDGDEERSSAAGQATTEPAMHGARAAMKTGVTHMLLMLAAVGFFTADLALRGGPAAPSGSRLAAVLVVDGLGAALLVIGGWYGGELVFRHGVGSDLRR